MKKLWDWICSLFTGDKIGVIWRTMFTATKNVVAEMVSDPKNQQAALDLARDLMGSGKSNEEKKETFNATLDAIDANKGYCPCQVPSALTKCHCAAFRLHTDIGVPCICGIYVKQPKDTKKKAAKAVKAVKAKK